jgi:hypothetical protein
MGAFETFVNANLGIRKPLILDSGHPTGSFKAAGIVGSEYIDTETNEIYEKTGENNFQDWSLIRKLGESLSDSQSSVSAQSFSTSINMPLNTDNLNIQYDDIGNQNIYLEAPRVFVSLRFNDLPEALYSHSIYGVDLEGFNIQLSDEMAQTGCHLDILITASEDQISGSV